MSRLTVFLVVSTGCLLLFGCGKPDGSVRNLNALVSQLEARSFEGGAKPEPLKIRLEFTGTLIFASPHSINGGQSNLTAHVGAAATQKLLDKSGLSESFQVFLVADSGRVSGFRWDKPAFVFNGVFIVKCQQGESLILDVQDKTLKGIRAEHE